MRRLFARLRSLLVVVLALVATLSTVSTSSAAWSASATAHQPAAPSAECDFVSSLAACQSTDHTVAYSDSPTGDASQCTFVFNIAWGDGISVTRTVTDPAPGHHLVASHVYATPRTYTITVAPQVTVGNCTATSSVHTFTLLAAPAPPAPSCKAPSVSVTPIGGPIGSQFVVKGAGWNPGGAIHIKLPSKGFFHAKQATPAVGAKGNWQTTVTVGKSPAATYTFTFTEKGCPPKSVKYSVTSTPWNGYVTYIKPTIVNQVSGDWTVPDLHCNLFSVTHSVATWVGLGGSYAGSAALVQAGVLSQCGLFGVQKNQLVWQVLPPLEQAHQTGIDVSTGDKIHGSVRESYESYTLEVRDITNGKSSRTSYTLPAKSAIPDSAEWIVEDLGNQGAPLAPFGTVTFTGCSYGPGGKQKPTTGNSLQYETGSPSGNKTSVSPITKASFSVRYLRS